MVSGAISWSRGLLRKIEEPMKIFKENKFVTSLRVCTLKCCVYIKTNVSHVKYSGSDFSALCGVYLNQSLLIVVIYQHSYICHLNMVMSTKTIALLDKITKADFRVNHYLPTPINSHDCLI